MKTRNYLILISLSTLVLAGCTKREDDINLHLVDYTSVTDGYWRINKVQFADALNGMMLTDYQDLQKTTDGGKTWTIVYSDPATVTTFDYPQKDTAYVFLQPSSFADQDVIRSLDGGATWTTISQLSDYVVPAFVSGKFGYAISAIPPSNIEQLVRTTNAGVTWTNFSAYNISTQLIGYTSNLSGYIVDGSSDFRITTDGGLTWTVTYDYMYACSQMSKTGTCYITDLDDGIMKSTDYGATWTQCLPSYMTKGEYSAIDFSGNLVVAVQGTNFVVSKDGGATWNNYILRDVLDFSAYQFDHVYALDDTHVLVQCRIQGNGGTSLLRLTFQ